MASSTQKSNHSALGRIRCAIEVAISVKNDSCGRVGTIPAIEAMQQRLRPFAAFSDRRSELEHYAATGPADSARALPLHVVTPEVGCAVNRALTVENQSAVRIRSVPELFSGTDPLKAV